MSRSSAPDPRSFLGLYSPVFRFDGLDAGWVESDPRLALIAIAGARATPNLRENSLLDQSCDANAIAWPFEQAASLLIINDSSAVPTEPLRILIRQVITNALEDERNCHQSASILRRTYAFSRQHSELIADTEIELAQEYGALLGAMSAGMKVKKLLLSNDLGVCGMCETNASQGWIPIELPFASGAIASQEHGGCPCGIVFRRTAT